MMMAMKGKKKKTKLAFFGLVWCTRDMSLFIYIYIIKHNDGNEKKKVVFLVWFGVPETLSGF